MDLVHKTHSLQEDKKVKHPDKDPGFKILSPLPPPPYSQGTILVHCSAGVGRTGTFLSVYKLWLDYINPEVKELAVFPTVLELRKQRCKMVQKKEQYAYIAKCLR